MGCTMSLNSILAACSSLFVIPTDTLPWFGVASRGPGESTKEGEFKMLVELQPWSSVEKSYSSLQRAKFLILKRNMVNGDAHMEALKTTRNSYLSYCIVNN